MGLKYAAVPALSSLNLSGIYLRAGLRFAVASAELTSNVGKLREHLLRRSAERVAGAAGLSLQELVALEVAEVTPLVLV